MKNRPNKWLVYHIVQGAYGQGWEDVFTSEDKKGAAQTLKEYNQYEPQYPHRLIARRVQNEQWKAKES